MIRALVCVGLLALSACTPKPQFVPDGYRDQRVAITSSTRFDAKRFAGDWRVIESFEQTPREATTSRLSFRPAPAGYLYVARTDPSPLDATIDISPCPTLKIGQFGRLSYSAPHASVDPIWVIWVDEDHRTAVLGTPSGRFGMIINRTPKLRSDRLKAAREILAFNGYDLTKLRKVSP